MRFELLVALKYLIPRWRQLSVSIISVVSVLVISLVVWLVILFMSVTEGIEKKWVEQLVALVAPMKLKPTEAYHHSYYYQIDEMSMASRFSSKTIGEKLIAAKSDPYNPQIDAELPSSFPQAERHQDGSLIDPVKEAWAILSSINEEGLVPRECEVSFGNLRLNVQKEDQEAHERESIHLNQVSYIAPFDEDNAFLSHTILPLSEEDSQNLLNQLKQFSLTTSPPTFFSVVKEDNKCGALPCNTPLGEGILVAKHFQASGVHVGDRGHLAYYTPNVATANEQRISVYVAGFYDPGVMPIGNKLIFVHPKTIAFFRSPLTPSDSLFGNGINLWFTDLDKADSIKKRVVDGLKEKGIDKYWTVESFRDYEFTKPILQQLQSDKNLFTLIALIILIVGCSNIISMLILLVNDKRREIGVLQSMGASPGRIAMIFGICGFTTGLLSCAIGVAAAIFSLHHLQSLVNFLSFLQGHEAFQSTIYGHKLPNELSLSVALLVSIATLMISSIAGLIPAWKASRIRATDILRAE